MNWVARVSGGIKNRVLATEYLQALAAAWDHGRYDDGHPMDPVLTEFRDQDEFTGVALWLAFMAGSTWEREHRARRYDDELTSTD